jgi:Polyketide cyclase / dehydrase and lipid transport
VATAISVEQSRAIPVDVQHAFNGTLPISLPTIFCRRYVLLPPIKEVRGQVGTWGQVGQIRTVVTSDGGKMREMLTDVDAPHSFTYQLDEITGPMRPLVDSIEGRWEFTSKGTGTLITWRWTLHPRGAGALLMPLIIKMWLNYAKQSLEQLSELLLSPEFPENPLI